MIIEDVLLLPSFTGAQVIAGAKGLGNEVTSAMVLEASDIENWGKKGQLIISSFYAIENLNDVDLAQFFRTMSTIGIAAIAFKPERLMSQAPEKVIELCDDFDLPLIKLSPGIKYESILLDVMGHILDSNLTLLNRFYEVHRHLMALALKQPSVSYILSTLKNTLHVDVTYLDTARDRRLSTDMDRAGFSGYSFTRRDPSAYQTHAYFDTRLFYDKGYGERNHQTLAEMALGVRIPSSDDIDYYLIMHNKGATLTPLDVMTIENVVSLLQMEILKQNAIKQKLFFQNNNLVHDLLLDRYGSHEKIDMALSTLEIDRYPLYEALLVRIEPTDPTDADRLDEVHRAVRRKLRTLYPGIVYFESSDRLVFIHNFRSTLSGFDLPTIDSALKELHDTSTLPLFTYFAILSSTADRYSFPRMNSEIIDAYKLFSGTQYHNRCMRFDDLGIFKLLLLADDLSQTERFIDPRLTKLARKHPDLLITLTTLCTNSLDYAKTAEQLFIHPKTVRYRIDRVRKLTGIDVKNPDDFLQVLLSEKILSLTGENTKESESDS